MQTVKISGPMATVKFTVKAMKDYNARRAKALISFVCNKTAAP